jgi:hypothetical protein
MKEREEDNEDQEPIAVAPKVWEEFHFAKFKSFKKQYVVCLNTMGQDRVFTAEE